MQRTCWIFGFTPIYFYLLIFRILRRGHNPLESWTAVCTRRAWKGRRFIQFFHELLVKLGLFVAWFARRRVYAICTRSAEFSSTFDNELQTRPFEIGILLHFHTLLSNATAGEAWGVKLDRSFEEHSPRLPNGLNGLVLDFWLSVRFG